MGNAGEGAIEPGPDISDFLAREGLALAVVCIRSSMILEESARAEISRLRSVIFSHHSAEYLPPIIASRLRITRSNRAHNRTDVTGPAREIAIRVCTEGLRRQRLNVPISPHDRVDASASRQRASGDGQRRSEPFIQTTIDYRRDGKRHDWKTRNEIAPLHAPNDVRVERRE